MPVFVPVRTEKEAAKYLTLLVACVQRWKNRAMVKPVGIEEVTDPVEIAKAQAQRKRDRSSAWLQAHGPEICARHRGKCVCVAGEETFVAVRRKNHADSSRKPGTESGCGRG